MNLLIGNFLVLENICDAAGFDLRRLPGLSMRPGLPVSVPGRSGSQSTSLSLTHQWGQHLLLTERLGATGLVQID